MKRWSLKLKEFFQNLPKSTFSGGYYRDGSEPKMTKWEAMLMPGLSSLANKGKVRDALRQITLLNPPDKGGPPYIEAKFNEAKDLLKDQAEKWSKCMMNFKFFLVMYMSTSFL